MVKKKNSSKQDAISALILTVAVIIIANVLAAFFYMRFDLTGEKRYSLAPPTVKLIEKLEDEVTIKIYLAGDLPSGFKRLEGSTRDLMNNLRAYGGKNIQFEFSDPLEGKTEKEKKEIYEDLSKKGLSPTNLMTKDKNESTQRIIFPGALVTYGGTTLPVQLLENQIGFSPEEVLNNSVIQLEYKFANAIKKLTQYRAPRIVFLQGHGELNRLELADIHNTLISYKYEVQALEIDSAYSIPSKFDLAIIAKPRKAFDERTKYKIDQYLMRGGKLLWLIDATTADMDSLKQNLTGQFVLDNQLNLDDQLFKYGVRINTDLVMDINLCGSIPLVIGRMGNAPQTQMFPWYYFPYLISDNNHAINRNLDPVAAKFASTIDTVRNPGVRKTILLHTTNNSKALLTPARLNFNILADKPDPKYFNQQALPVAALLEGEFQSVFTNRVSPSFLAIGDSVKELKFMEKSKPSKMIVIADGDVMRNDIRTDGTAYPLGYQPYTQQTLSNKDFILNCIEYLSDEDGLLETRNKEVKLRLLDATKVNEDKVFWQVMNIVVPIAIISLLSAGFTYYRRKKYAS